MKRLLRLLILLFLLPSVAIAGDCPWTVRGAIRVKLDAIKKCGPADTVNSLGSYQSGPNIRDDEQWVYFNSDGTISVLTFRGDKLKDFDTQRR